MRKNAQFYPLMVNSFNRTLPNSVIQVFSQAFLARINRSLPIEWPGKIAYARPAALFNLIPVRRFSGLERRGDKKAMQPTSSEPFSYEPFPSAGLVAYFSMEIAINPGMPTYAGGLGVLAGDTLRSAADLGVPLAAFSLVHRKGYFKQLLDKDGKQNEDVQPWNPADFCTEEKARVTVSIENRIVTMRCWRYDMKGRYGHVVPIYLLDTDLDGNTGWDRGLTDHLYGGDTNYRLEQEIVLGMGGARMASALGHKMNVYHMNEGHAALLTLALLERQLGGGRLRSATESDIEQVRKKCVFTTHTPVPAGHDRFSTEQSIRILGGDRTARLEKDRK